MTTINVPNSMDIMSNMPTEDNQSPVNKFFNTLESTPANVNGNNAFSAENTFNMNSAPELNFNFDTPTSSLRNQIILLQHTKNQHLNKKNYLTP